MALPIMTVEASVDIVISDKTADRALVILGMWLEDHPDKTIVVEQEDDLRVCLIADREKSNAEKKQSV